MTVEEQRARVLAWEGCFNVRDLGGYATRDGRETHWGRIVRSAHMGDMTEAGQRALIAYNVRTIIDVRMPDEAQKPPSPFQGHPEVQYRNLPFMDDPMAPAREGFVTLAQDYIQSLEWRKAPLRQIMTTIAHAPEGAVLFHCHAGKDRTGIISALLLHLAGVPEETIAADYGLTAECLWPLDQEWIENGPGERAEREASYEKYRARPEVMLEVLKYLEDRYGGVEGFLLHLGVEPDDIQRLRARLLQD